MTPHPRLPEICVVTLIAESDDGTLLAVPTTWNTRQKPPHIMVMESATSPAPTIGDRALVKLRRIRPHYYQAQVLRLLALDPPRLIIGMLARTKEGGIIEPISRKSKESFLVSTGDLNGAEHGELVSAMTLPDTPSLSVTYARITERLGSLASPKAASLIATHVHALPSVFSPEALLEAEAAQPPVASPEREDLREVPLITIDGSDARDFDDAVYAEPTSDGFHLIVAIADVAHYVAEGSALDRDAYLRGNSVYFPDRVLPMLPERLSNGLCSLMPDQDRYCMAVHLWIDKHGTLQRYQFTRAIMRSHARLTYEQMESYQEQPATLQPAMTHLWHAYAALAKERDHRGALDLNLPEYRVVFDASGHVADILPKARLESHRLIEAFMIAANVAAADQLIAARTPAMFRAHEAPAEEKLEELRLLLRMSGYNLAKGHLTAKQFNHILHQSEGKPEAWMIHHAVLRGQMQAFYAAENIGHFGLALRKYCHFTSPIRRYADLAVHRALIRILTAQKAPSPHPSTSHLTAVALHISETERKAMMAERDANDRYKASYMARHVGRSFEGLIAGMNEHGLFVTLAMYGVQGFIPVRHLGADFFMYDKRHSRMRGQRSKQEYRLGDRLWVRVADASALTGNLLFLPEAVSDAPSPRTPRSKPQAKKRPKHRR